MPIICMNSRYQQYLLVMSLFFFLNIYILYNTASYNRVVNSSTEDEVKSRISRADPLSQNISAVDELCEITDELAVSALRRVKTNECRKSLTEAACRLKDGTFHDTFPESQCPNHDPLLIDLRVGCFSDRKASRTLKEFDYKLPLSNSKSICRKNCYKAGFLYYGLEFGEECFCGNKIENATSLDDEKCQTYKCPGENDQFCGGFNAIEIFRTGFRDVMTIKKPKFVDQIEKNLKRSKILFLLQLNGRNVRQVKRFLKSIYSPYHYYYVHVDKRQNFMHHEMQIVAEKLKNMIVSNKRFSTIWGGASLLEMFQTVVKDSIQNKEINDWDYIFNFSESDFPVLPISDFENLINSNYGYSFLASHGYNTGRFIQKQGFEYVFQECEERMWRIGKREFPDNIRIDGGSDWVGIHRDLAEYSISDEEIPRKLRDLFKSILLPLESFYHTLAFNSKFCGNILSSNLRVTNWYRKQGCRCAGLKKVVDWCGCSPLVFRNDTISKFEKERAIKKPTYFARKFDSIVNIDAIAYAESQSLSNGLILKNHESYSSAFANIYMRKIDGDAKHFFQLAQSILNLAEERSVELKRLDRIDAFRANSNSSIWTNLKMDTSNGESQYALNRKTIYQIYPHSNIGGFELKNMKFGVRFEYKEEICREYMGIITKDTTVQIRMEWKPYPGVQQPVKSDKTSPEIETRWKDPNGKIIAVHNVKKYDSVFGGQFDDLNLAEVLKNESINYGEYSVDVVSLSETNQVIGTIYFPVYPENDHDKHMELTRKYFEIIDHCTDSQCYTKYWSTSFPDPKSEILYGYDKEELR